MNTKGMLVKAVIVASWFSMPFSIMAQYPSLTLKHGVYVQAGTACKDAPFAAMKSWDGAGLAGPHSSRCTSKIIRHRGNQYKVSTACSALGDGTPNPSGTSDTETIELTRLSDTSFTTWNTAKAKATYRWCSAQ